MHTQPRELPQRNLGQPHFRYESYPPAPAV